MVTIHRLRSDEPDDESAWETLDVTNHQDNNNNNNQQQHPESKSSTTTPSSQRRRGGEQQQQQQQHELPPQSENGDDDDSYEPLGAAASPQNLVLEDHRSTPPSLDIATPQDPPHDADKSSSDVLKESLVDHPMHLFWSRFLFHFMQELWKLDMHIRLALALIILGVIVRLFLWATWFVWNPRMFLMTILLVGPYLYLQRESLQQRLEQNLGSCSSPEALLESLLDKVEPAQLRRLLFFVLLLPTLLEARTIVFLSSIKIDQAQYGTACWSPVYYNVIVATLLAMGAYYGVFVRQRLTPRECLQRALLFLYACALCVSLTSLDLWRLPHLLAPFSLSSGVLILAWHDDDDDANDWFSNCVRQALRLTVRDILASITDSVCQDEMLQLAMLRWVVDYWSTASTNTSSSSSSTTTSFSTPGSQPQPPSTTAGGAHERSTQLQWDELGPMLNTTTNQMELEVRSLHQNPPPPPARPTSTSTAGASNMYTSANIPNGSQSNHHSASASASRSKNGTSRTASDPVFDLQSLLASFDLDERAKPAVMAYKRGVEAFPPERNWAISFAIIHRCPSVLALAWQVYYYGTSGLGESLLLPWTVTCSAMLILLPLIALELLRIHTWIGSCQAASSSANKMDNAGDEEEYAACLQRLDPMTILLSNDSYNPQRPPTLLRVWWNVVDSVAALEVGIVTTRCLQTTAVAAEFADNVRSLLQFGAEVREHGWIHGLAVAFKEVVLYHQQQNPNTTGDPRETSPSSSSSSALANAATDTHPPTAKYANAAVGAFRNSQRMSRNLQILTQEEDVTQLGKPLVSVLSVITGYGWLWGKQEGEDKVTNQVVPSEPNPTNEDNVLSLSCSPQPSTDEVRVLEHDAPKGDGMAPAESSKSWSAKTDDALPTVSTAPVKEDMVSALQEPSVDKGTAPPSTESHDSSNQAGGQSVASVSKAATHVPKGPVDNSSAPSGSHRTNDMLDFTGNLQNSLNARDAAPTDLVSANADDEWEGLDLGSLDVTPTCSTEDGSINDPLDQCRPPTEQEEEVDSDQGKGFILGLAAAAIGIGAAVAIAGQNNGDKEKNDKEQRNRSQSNSAS